MNRIFAKYKLLFIIPFLIIALWSVGIGSMLMMGMSDDITTHHGAVMRVNCPFFGLPQTQAGPLSTNSCFDLHTNLIATISQVAASDFSYPVLIAIASLLLVSLWVPVSLLQSTQQKILKIYYKRDAVTIGSIKRLRIGRWLVLHEMRDHQLALATA